MKMSYAHLIDLRSIVACLFILLSASICAQRVIVYTYGTECVNVRIDAFDKDSLKVISTSAEEVSDVFLNDDCYKEETQGVVPFVSGSIPGCSYDPLFISRPIRKAKYKFDNFVSWTKFRYTAGDDQYT